MNGTTEDGVVHVGGDARQRFHDSKGYGRPLSGNTIALAPVEAAHLLFRGDLDAVDGVGFQAFFERASDRDPAFAVRFLVYADLRSRGFYLSPAIEGWVPDDTDFADFVVYERGKGPGSGAVRYRVRVVGERDAVRIDDVAAAAAVPETTVLGIVDEESEITYLELTDPDVAGDTAVDLPDSIDGVLLGDRVLCWDAPDRLYRSGFFGRPLSDRDDVGDAGAVQVSLVEAAYLADRGTLAVDGGSDAVVACGRDVEGERFDRRLATYTRLRERGVVPKTGFKFGADFRTYASVDTVDDLGHSELLVRALSADHAFVPRDLALDVRLAHGVRKQMVYSVVADGEVLDWVAVGRLTP
jgi:tRNA-intron endonuclease